MSVPWGAIGDYAKTVFGTLLVGLGQEQQQHPAVHTGKLAGGGSVAVAVGVSDM